LADGPVSAGGKDGVPDIREGEGLKGKDQPRLIERYNCPQPPKSGVRRQRYSLNEKSSLKTFRKDGGASPLSGSIERRTD